MMRAFVAVLLAAALLSLSTGALAHEVRPALVQITQRDAQHFDLLWKQPVNGDVALRLTPRLSDGALDRAPNVATALPAYAIKIWRNLSVPRENQTLEIAGLERSITDVLISVTLLDGRSSQQILTPRHTSVALDFNTDTAPRASGYLTLGIEHILGGVDHLLFVLGLLLLVRRFRPLLTTITAFTVAHSLTLAATTLGWINVPSAVVEALVALSIVILAVELVRNAGGEQGVTSRYPWLIAFAFGLLHGCAFAGALAEIGLPAKDIPLALLLFNVGVETGQILFILAASGVLYGVTWLFTRSRAQPRIAVSPAVPGAVSLAAPYAIGTFAFYWFISRVHSI